MSSDTPTPYCDQHAEPVRVVADTYDLEALVVPYRKAVNLERELAEAIRQRDEARAVLMDFEYDEDGFICTWPIKSKRDKAAGLDA